MVTSNTLPGRFPGSGMFMNTLSGSLTFSRHRKNPYFSPTHHPSAMMSQSAVLIPQHHHQHRHLSQPWLNGSSLNVAKPPSTTVSLGNLQSPKTAPLPPLPQAPLPPTDLEVAISDTYAMQNAKTSAMNTPNSTSASTRRQTLLSADTVTTNISGGGQSSPGIAIVHKGASADGLVDEQEGEMPESPDVNQVFSATLPWKSKPQGGVAGGLKRLSTFLRSAMSGSSGSFNTTGHNHSAQAQSTSITPGGTRRQYPMGAWPASPATSSNHTSGANSLGVLSLTQSRFSYTSDATLQPGELSTANRLIHIATFFSTRSLLTHGFAGSKQFGAETAIVSSGSQPLPLKSSTQGAPHTHRQAWWG